MSEEKPNTEIEAAGATVPVGSTGLLDADDVHDKVHCLYGYLKIWAKGKHMPSEIPDLLEEVEEWLNGIGADRDRI